MILRVCQVPVIHVRSRWASAKYPFPRHILSDKVPTQLSSDNISRPEGDRLLTSFGSTPGKLHTQ